MRPALEANPRAILSDEELVIACRRGDAAAWEAIVARYQDLIYRIPRHIGLSEELAAEVFQQVFTTLVEQLGAIDHPARVGAWLITTTRRESWRVHRREGGGRLFTTLDTAAVLDLPDGAPPADEAMLRQEELQRVRDALEALDKRCRRLLLLLFGSPDPPAYAEVAAALGMPEGSIGPTRARCLQKLRRLMEDVLTTA